MKWKISLRADKIKKNMILPAHFYTGVDKNAKTKVSQSTVVFFYF